jgi:hypothetical protein
MMQVKILEAAKFNILLSALFVVHFKTKPSFHFCEFYVIMPGPTMLGGSLFTTAWRVLRLRMEGTASVLVGKPEGKRPLGRSRRRWVDNIKMDLREIEWDGVD